MKILIIRNKITYSVDESIAKFTSWMEKNTPLKPQIEAINANLDVKHKVFINSMYGLDGIKQQIRDANLVTPNINHVVIFLYELGAWDYSKQLAAWTYPNALHGAVFIEIPCSENFNLTDELLRLFSHEWLHGAVRLCWWKDVAVNDLMDTYFREWEISAPDGNRAQQLKLLSPYWKEVDG